MHSNLPGYWLVYSIRVLAIECIRLAPEYLPFEEGWRMQQELHKKITESQTNKSRQASMIFCEHEPVYTAGARTRSWEMPQNEKVIRVGRGGKITWHGPGQLVGYPILSLGATPDVLRYVRQIEEGLINALQSVGINGFRIAGRSGVWVRNGVSDEKVAAIGVRVQKNVTLHGFALNCSNDLAPFEKIVPCGISDAGVTTISRILKRTITPKEILDSVFNSICSALEYINTCRGNV
ncbi:MAG: lipoyl(octanoyl) transferase LipB [Tropheryma whipplei]|nr:lipoyl(octanoyl) transferase LipB [Tropheryma whipplei]